MPHTGTVWATQLRALLQHVRTAADIQDWLGALSPSLCKEHPDLPMRLSARLGTLLGEFTLQELTKCVTTCLDKAWAASSSATQASSAWSHLCAALHCLSLPAMNAFLDCLHDQKNRQQLPGNGPSSINHVTAVIGHMANLPALGFGTVVVPIAAHPPVLGDNELMVIDAGAQRHAIQAPGSNGPMKLNREMLKLAMAHLLHAEGVDWMRPEAVADIHQEDLQKLLDLALVDKYFFDCFSPMLANYPWLQKEVRLRGELTLVDPQQLERQITKLIVGLVDIPAQTTASMVCTPGVAQRRLDIVLRALFFGVFQNAAGGVDTALQRVYVQLRDRATLQMVTLHQGQSPSFAQHLELTTLPLQFMITAYRMLGLGPQPYLPVMQWMGGQHLLAFPQHVQALTLISLLSVPFDPVSRNWLRGRVDALMADPDSWPTPPHKWLLYQASNLDDMLALIEPAPRPSGLQQDAAAMAGEQGAADKFLAMLQQHHGVNDEVLLIDDPFGENYVPWTVAEIRLLAALCKRAEASNDWKPPALVDCLVHLLRRHCLLCAPGQRFASPHFMMSFPLDTVRAAFFRLTAQEQGAMLIRVYSDGEPQLQLIGIFAGNQDIPASDRQFTLRTISALWDQGPECRSLVNTLVA
ncbi:hypothetical protein GCM10023165_33670 [Variovorax defluvii]|uniref:Helicase XPB/Ssl2 N-terminal domain-containing protein n=2 Tax=Variovorax defluvii TaxID=913761 RepID=A0ABP8HZB5_9BURK